MARDVRHTKLPVRQWVLSLPYRLRYLLAWNHGLCRAVLGVFARTLLGFYRQQTRRRGIASGHTGTVTVIQRFGGGLNLNVHLHTLVLDGVFAASGGALVFHGAPPLTDTDVGRVVVTVRRRVLRLLARRGFAPEVGAARDPLVEASPVLAGIPGASVLGQIALGPHAGARVWRLGADPDAPWITSTGPCQPHLEGFDLHAAVRVAGHERRRLEHLCRYLMQPPFGQERVRRLTDGRVVVELKRAWADGTTHLLFEPLEFLEKLAALTPRPRINLILYHGVLAPHARWRNRIVPDPAAAGGAAVDEPAVRPRHWCWADLMRRAFDLDVLACPRCGGRMRLLATLEDPLIIEPMLARLGLPSDRVRAAPPQPSSSTVLLFADTPA